MSTKTLSWVLGVGILGAATGLATTTGCGGEASTGLPPLKDSYGPFDGQRAFAHAKAMVEIGPRPAGSEALKRNADYIRSELDKLGLQMEVQEFSGSDPAAKGITFRNLWCDVPGEDPENGPIILVCAHYDTKKTSGFTDPTQNFRFVGAMDGAGPSATLLELARVLVAGKREPTIRLVWFDGEESIPFVWDTSAEPGRTNLIGSAQFADWLSEEKLLDRAKVMILLDLLGSKNLKIDRDHMSHKKLNDLFEAVAGEMGESERMFRYMSNMTDDHLPFQRKGMKVIDLIDFRFRYANDRKRHGDEGPPPPDGAYVPWWHTPEDDLQNMDPRSLDFCGNLVLKALPRVHETFYR